MTGLNSVLSHSPAVVTRKTGNEYVLVPVANNIADMNSVFILNETGAFIWEQIDGKRTVEEIIAVITEEFEVDYETASKDVFDFITNMKNFLIDL
jgi:methyltransferase-like protein